jgi:RNA polymerase sigma-70 factor (ECF subfamily)
VGLPVDQLPDETLLSGYAGGDDELTVAFVRRFQSRIYGVALAVTGDPGTAEDVAQQAFFRAWLHGHSYDPRRGSVSTWLAAIARNLAIDSTRVRRPVPVDADALLSRVVAVGDGPEQKALLGESADQLRSALRRLPREQARALVLSAVAGMSASQVAACEGIPLGTAKTRIRTGMYRLRAALIASEAERD